MKSKYFFFECQKNELCIIECRTNYKLKCELSLIKCNYYLNVQEISHLLNNKVKLNKKIKYLKICL